MKKIEWNPYLSWNMDALTAVFVANSVPSLILKMSTYTGYYYKNKDDGKIENSNNFGLST